MYSYEHAYNAIGVIV